MNDSSNCRLEICLLNGIEIRLDGAAQALPRSRKTKALLALLALGGKTWRRDELCQLLWNVPNDPRAALRWSLAKLRPLLTEQGQTVLLGDRDTVSLDSERVLIDVEAIQAALASEAPQVSADALMRLEERFGASYLPGLDDVGSPEFRLWLDGARESLVGLHRRVLDALLIVHADDPEQALKWARKRAALDPLETQSNIVLLRILHATRGRKHAADALENMRSLYRQETLSDAPLIAAWRQLSAGAVAIDIDAAASPDDVSDAIALPDKPSVAVLDFENLGGDESSAVLATGLAVDLNSRLARLRNLFVIARLSAARFSTGQYSPREISARLGVRYLVTGSTRRAGNRLRVTVTLLDATTGNEVWAERYERALDDLFIVQDEITDAVAAALEPAIERSEMERALVAPTQDLNAWELYHKGLWHAFRFTANDTEAAHALFRQAAARDPRFSRAYAGLSLTHYSRAFLNSVPSVGEEIDRALEDAHKGVDLDGRDAMAHWSLGRALFLSCQHDQALAAIDRALLSNPNYAQGYYAQAFIGVHAELGNAVLPVLDTAQRLSPFDPLLFAIKSTRAISLAIEGDYDAAAAWSVRGTNEPNAHFHIYAIAAACLELAGRSEDAYNNAKWALARHPAYSAAVFRRSFPHENEARRQPIIDAMRRAGIPERSNT